jgi:hypothetical protein
VANVYVDTGGNANYSGSTDSNTPTYSITVHASYVSGATVPIVESHDLTVLSTSGATQDSCNFPDATNTNQDIFWIQSVDNASSPKTITFTVAPTGLTAGSSAGIIGGRILLAGITGEESFLRAGDTVNINNSPAAAAGPLLTLRTAGDGTSGYVKIKGTSGYPTLNSTGNNDTITGAVAYQWIEGLTIDQDGTSGSAINMTNANCDNWVIKDNRIIDAGGDGINSTSAGTNLRLIQNEIANCGANGFDASDTLFTALFNYIHDCTANGILLNSSTNVQVVAFNIIEGCTGRGILKSGTSNHTLVCINNTIVNCDDSGLEAAGLMFGVIYNNIFLDNGTTTGQFNIELASNAMNWLMSDYNCFSIAGSRGGQNLDTDYTAGSNDITTDPDLNNPSGGDFGLGGSSPAKAAGISGEIW